MFCSLKSVTSQSIPPRKWTPLRFELINTDESSLWHPVTDLNSPASALITPAGLPTPGEVTGVLLAMVQWAHSSQDVDVQVIGGDGGTATVTLGQSAMQYARDPYAVRPAVPDTTATRDRPNGPGADYDTNAWAIVLHNGQPLALRVYHDDPVPRVVTLAEFKLLPLAPVLP